VVRTQRAKLSTPFCWSRHHHSPFLREDFGVTPTKTSSMIIDPISSYPKGGKRRILFNLSHGWRFTGLHVGTQWWTTTLMMLSHTEEQIGFFTPGLYWIGTWQKWALTVSGEITFLLFRPNLRALNGAKKHFSIVNPCCKFMGRIKVQSIFIFFCIGPHSSPHVS
jgi:hypothetical protein